MSDLENNKWVMAAVVIVANLLVTFVVVKTLVCRQDGMQRIGWTASSVVMDNKRREVYLPVFIKTEDYKELHSPEGK